jgi:ketosteroid isomerase-like protein
MSRENVEVARSCVDALNRRDLDGYLACCTDDVELVPATVAVEGTYSGPNGIRRFFADVQATAPDFRLDVERLEAVGPDRVLAFELGRASGRTSGITFLEEGIPFGTVYDFYAGKIKRVRVFADRQVALKAVGLSE